MPGAMPNGMTVPPEFQPAVVMPPSLSGRPLWFVVRGGGLVIARAAAADDPRPGRAGAGPGPGPEVVLPDGATVAAMGLDPATAHFLGTLGGEHVLALDAGEAALPPGHEAAGLRQLWGRLDEARFAVAGRAVQVIGWAEAHRYCGRCATPTVRDPAERCLRCPRCELSSYPRISPTIITLVRRGDQALLARSARFPRAFYSTLAGFVEVGESLEQTLHREVREEVGVEVENVRYFGSQPWPFPHSLMIGFFADHAGGEIRIDGQEIADARWFDARELPEVPPRISIARRLIDTWVGEVTGRDAAPRS